MMADDTGQRGPQDRSRINPNEPWELRYWSEKLGVSSERLRAAVQQVGPSVEKVEQYLEQGSGAQYR
jgi:hypothetical protein